MWQSKDRKIDLTSWIMSLGICSGRTVYFSVHTIDPSWRVWNEKRVALAEWLINSDLGYDGYRVKFMRLEKVGSLPCTSDFRWKLTVRRMPWHLWS